ncbi:MAG: hypothetical protein QOF51_1585, partial [Chloroflexota bacterium]|nr:hypothetical protein [Chloroflexota bacterium]
ADFSVASPQPRNSAAALHACPPLSTRTPTPSPTVAATPTVAGAARATATPTPGPTRMPTSIPTPSPAILRFVVVLDGSPDPTAGAYTADGAVYGAGSVGSAGVPADGVAPLGRYHAFGLRTGPGVGELAATHLVSFAGGELSARGAAPLVVPITGGNGAYAGARGELRLRPLGEDGRAFAVEAIVSRGQAVPLATVTSRAAATATSVAMTPFLSLTPTLVSTGPGWIVQLTPAPDDQLLAGDLYTARDLQDDGAMRPSAHPVGAYRAWILPDGDGASTQTVSVQLGTAGEVVATGLALGGGMPITGGSGDYRNARGVLMLTPLGDNSNLLAVALRPGAEPLRVTVTPSPTSTVEPTA